MVPYYESGGIVIYHGCSEDVVPALAIGDDFDLILTDPPYAVSVAGSEHVGRRGKGVRRLDFFYGDDDWKKTTRMVEGVLTLCIERLSAHGSVYAWVGHRQFGPVVDLLESGGFQTRFLVWSKECPALAPPGSGWPSGAELCVYAYRAGRIWNHRGADTPRSNVLIADSYRHGQPGKVKHPTQKPLTVIAPLMIASSESQSLILDPFTGSGTTLVVAKSLGRRAVGIEREERFCEIAARRLSQEVLPLEVTA